MSRIVHASLIATLVFAWAALPLSAQVCPDPTPAGFDGVNGLGGGNQAILEVVSETDSTDVLNNDNTAHVGLGQSFAINFFGNRVPAASPFSIGFSTGVVSSPISTPLLDGDVWLDLGASGNVFLFVDGLALTGGFPTPGATTAPPPNFNGFFLNAPVDPAFLGMCFTFQAAVQDPASPAPNFLSFSNPVAIGLLPGVFSVAPKIAAVGGSSNIIATGQNVVGGDLVTTRGQLAPVSALTSSGGFFSVPGNAVSGPVTIDIGGITSTIRNDSINDWLVVSDSSVVLGPALLNLNSDPTLLNGFRASGAGTLLVPGGSHIWPINLTAGDIIDVEVYSTDSTFQNVFDGFGTAFNPSAIGMDPMVTLQSLINFDQLVFDTFNGSQNLHSDDDSGPGNNASLRFQVPVGGQYNLVVADSNPAVFGGGAYFLNVRVERGVPAVRGFQNSAAERVNVVTQSSPVTIVAPNVVSGRQYSVVFRPVADPSFSSRVITNITATGTGFLNVTLPAATATDQPVGLHRVHIIDQTSGTEGIEWNNSAISPPTGVLPDLLTIRGSTYTAAAGTLTVLSNVGNETVLYNPPALPPINIFGGFVQAMAPPNASLVYVEALGINTNDDDLFDSLSEFLAGGALGNGIYNPILNVFRPTLTDSGPQNDNDGVVPFPVFDAPLGIGRNAAVIDFEGPANYPGGGLYTIQLRQAIITGVQAQQACIVNVVIR